MDEKANTKKLDDSASGQFGIEAKFEKWLPPPPRTAHPHPSDRSAPAQSSRHDIIDLVSSSDEEGRSVAARGVKREDVEVDVAGKRSTTVMKAYRAPAAPARGRTNPAAEMVDRLTASLSPDAQAAKMYMLGQENSIRALKAEILQKEDRITQLRDRVAEEARRADRLEAELAHLRFSWSHMRYSNSQGTGAAAQASPIADSTMPVPVRVPPSTSVLPAVSPLHRCSPTPLFQRSSTQSPLPPPLRSPSSEAQAGPGPATAAAVHRSSLDVLASAAGQTSDSLDVVGGVPRYSPPWHDPLPERSPSIEFPTVSQLMKGKFVQH